MTDSKKVDGSKEESEKHEFKIQIDRAHYTVTESALTGAQLRNLPQPPIGPERDLFEVVPGKSDDEKIELTDSVTIKDGERFFTAPARINPGNES